MTVAVINDITIMPNEFDFKSKINSLCSNIIYHAKRKGITDYYIITWDIENSTVTDKIYYKKMYGKLKYGDFAIVGE